METTNKEVIFTRPHKTIYAAGDRIIKVFDERYTKADVLNEARNEALVEENTGLNIPALLEVSHTEEGWCLVREKVEGKTLEQFMKDTMTIPVFGGHWNKRLENRNMKKDVMVLTGAGQIGMAIARRMGARHENRDR